MITIKGQLNYILCRSSPLRALVPFVRVIVGCRKISKIARRGGTPTIPFCIYLSFDDNHDFKRC